MAGNTGKMTADAIRERGPRMCVTEARYGTITFGVVVRREGTDCFRQGRFNNLLRFHDWSKSYTLSYVMGVARNLRQQMMGISFK